MIVNDIGEVVDQVFAPHNVYLDFLCFVYSVQSSSGALLSVYFSLLVLTCILFHCLFFWLIGSEKFD